MFLKIKKLRFICVVQLASIIIAAISCNFISALELSPNSAVNTKLKFLTETANGEPMDKRVREFEVWHSRFEIGDSHREMVTINPGAVVECIGLYCDNMHPSRLPFTIGIKCTTERSRNRVNIKLHDKVDYPRGGTLEIYTTGSGPVVGTVRITD